MDGETGAPTRLNPHAHALLLAARGEVEELERLAPPEVSLLARVMWQCAEAICTQVAEQ